MDQTDSLGINVAVDMYKQLFIEACKVFTPEQPPIQKWRD